MFMSQRVRRCLQSGCERAIFFACGENMRPGAGTYPFLRNEARATNQIMGAKQSVQSTPAGAPIDGGAPQPSMEDLAAADGTIGVDAIWKLSTRAS